jgi:Tol biopolymer transport system component
MPGRWENPAPRSLVVQPSIDVGQPIQTTGYRATSLGVHEGRPGRYVAFLSLASNLVPRDSNGRRNPLLGQDVFVHDRQTGQITRISVAADQRQALGPSFDPSISADGRRVAFTSDAANLVLMDSNRVGDVFVRDRQAGTTVRVSVASDGAQANDSSSLPAISGDGAAVAFFSAATNLVVGDVNQTGDVFVRELAP